jgi:hypothetical protein
MMKRTFLTTLVSSLAISHGFSIVKQKSAVSGVGFFAKPSWQTSLLVVSQPKTSRTSAHATTGATPMNHGYCYYYSSDLSMSSSSSNDGDDQEPKMEFGHDRGNVLFVIALSICIWMFSIPTEFRRAYICSNEYCTGT